MAPSGGLRDPKPRRVFALTMCVLFIVTVVQASSAFGRSIPSGRVNYESAFTPSPGPSEMPPLPEAGGVYIPLPPMRNYPGLPLFDPQCVACPYDCGRVGATRLGRHCCLECTNGEY